MHAQELPAGGAAPLLPGGCNEVRKTTLAGGFQIVLQVLSILCHIPFIQVFYLSAGIFRAITA
jgi:hypothetical protein